MEGLVLLGIFLPFAGTCFGSAWVLILNQKAKSSTGLFIVLNAFASGVMLAASVWSLIIPASQLASYMIIICGIMAGIIVMSCIERLSVKLNRTNNSMLALSVAIHNFPEGMAVGAVLAAVINGNASQSIMGCMMLSVGIALQNIPEGAIISMPLYLNGYSKARCFYRGFLSAVIEELGAVLTMMFYTIFTAALPFLLCFAAGAMIYAVIGELMPEIAAYNSKNTTVFSFATGFCIMMALDMLFV